MNLNNARDLFQLQIELIDAKIEKQIYDKTQEILQRIRNFEEKTNLRLTKLENSFK